MQDYALLGIVLFPLLGALVTGLFGRLGPEGKPQLSRSAVHAIACGAVGASFALAVFSFVQLMGKHEGADGPNPVLAFHAYEWFSLTVRNQVVPVNVRFVMDALSGVMALVVTGIGFLIHIYSTGYMSEEPSYGRFFSYLNLFTASMLILILGSSLPLMFVGWEGVGLCSYLLIGFWYETPAYAAAGRKAFVANRIGDFGVLIGMFLLMATTGSFEFGEINAKAELTNAMIQLPGLVVPGITVATAATIFLFLGCTGKSAQLPLYVWLPDAMAGPTPVSALIHAATMVTSGLYLICRLSPVFALAPDTLAVIAIVGTLTALLAATIGCVQNDIKKVLAYSTVSQLGFMFAAAGCGAFAASFFHVYTHAFFKACLFLGAGSVMHAVGAHGDADIRELGGLKKYMPKTRLTFLVSCMAIAGVPLFSGFFSKDEILVGALNSEHVLGTATVGNFVFVGLVAAATMTAFYMFRLYFLTFEGSYRGGPSHGHEAAHSHAGHGHAYDAEREAHAAHDEHAAESHGHGHGEPHESPAAMTFPLLVLGFGALVAGYVWIGIAHFQPWVNWLQPALAKAHEGEHHGVAMAMTGGLFAAVVGIGLAMAWYLKPSETPAKLAASFPGVHQFLMDKWRVDELYDATILRGSRALGLVSAGFDKITVDGLLTKVTAEAVRGGSFVLTRMQNGLVHAYAAMMAAGTLGVVLWFAVPHIDVEAAPTQDGASASDMTLSAGTGLGYAYRWDFDGDGEPDTAWSTEPTVSHSFANEELHEGLVVTVEPARYGAGLQEHCVAEGDVLLLTGSLLGESWQRPNSDGTAPHLVVTAEGLEVTPHGARVSYESNQLAADEKVVVPIGKSVRIGTARVSVSGKATPAVIVRNAFGVERRKTLQLTVPPVSERPSVEILSLNEARR